MENEHDSMRFMAEVPPGCSPVFLSFDWLTLDALRSRGMDVHPFEEFIPRDVGMKYQEIMEERVRGWYYEGMRDVSECEGISLGASFQLEFSQYFAYAYRYGVSFVRAVMELEPASISAYLLPHGDQLYVENTMKRLVLVQVARHFGLPLEEHDSGGPEMDQRLPEVVYRDTCRLGPGKRVFFRMVSATGRLVDRIRKSRPEVMIYPEGHFFDPLFERYIERIGELGFRVIFPVMSKPPRHLLLRMIRRGTIPFYPREPNNKSQVRLTADRIREGLNVLFRTEEWKRSWEIEGVDFSGLFAGIIEQSMDRGLYDTARFTSACMVEVNARHITAMVLPNDCARSVRILLEIARLKGIETFYFEHGMRKYRLPSADRTGRAPVDWMICWGERDRSAYTRMGADERRLIRFTPPFLARYLPPRPIHNGDIQKVLILEHCCTKDHVNGLSYRGSELLVELYGVLKSRGVSEVRLKIHPGMTIKAYFERLLSRYDMDMKVFMNEDLIELILWSDLVIGPISTAAIEVLLLGRNYCCLDLEGLEWQGKSAFDGERLRIRETVDEAVAAIGEQIDGPGRDMLLRSICGIETGTTRADILDPLLDFFDSRYGERNRMNNREATEGR